MNKINWRVRIKNVNFWVALVPAVCVLVQCVAKSIGVDIDLSGISDNLLGVVNALFVVLAIVGIVNDPTTEKLKDSDRAMTYEKPY